MVDATTLLSSSSPGGGGAGGSGGGGAGGSGGTTSEMDERLVAQAALDAAEEQLQSLCASHAGTFVSVERRGRITEEALRDLQRAIRDATSKVQIAQKVLEQNDDDNYDESSENENHNDNNNNNDDDSGSGGSRRKNVSLAVLAERHRVRRRTLLQHSSLLELLELPSLMDACVRSNLYDEALSIAAFANTLERRHKQDSSGSGGGGGTTGGTGSSSSNSNAVVSKVIAQIRMRQTLLRQHLLHRLKSHVTMPQCLEVVTALRRLNSIDLENRPQPKPSVTGSSTTSSTDNYERIHNAMEIRLQVDFLEARDAWLDSSSSSSSASASAGMGSMTATLSGTGNRPSLVPVQPTEQLLDAIERYRTRVFEVATQFNAIFRARSAMITSQQQHSSSTTNSAISLLSMWMSRRVHAFLNMLSVQLAANTDDSTALRDALEASIFFASSMGRLGADFTPQLEPLFTSRMHAIVTKPWHDGAQHLAETLKVCREAGVASPLVSHNAGGGSGGSGPDADGTGPSASDLPPLDEPQPPPRQLLALPPLARFVNSILTGLNELRRCLLPGIFAQLRKSLNGVLMSVKETLIANERAVLTPGLRGEASQLRETAAKFQTVFADIVDPYVRGSLEAALGNTNEATRYHTILRNNEKGPDPTPVEEEKEEEENAKEEQSEEDAANRPETAEATDTPGEGTTDDTKDSTPGSAESDSKDAAADPVSVPEEEEPKSG